MANFRKFRRLLLAASIAQVLCVSPILMVYAQDQKAWDALMAAGASAVEGENYDTAVGEYSKALQESSEKFGSNDWRTAMSLAELGACRWALGDYDKAKTLLERALKIYESAKELPDQAVQILVSRAWLQLGGVLQKQNDLAKAEDCYQRAVNIRKATLGASHLSTATAIGELASVKVERSQYAEAEQLYKEALKIGDPIVPKDMVYHDLLIGFAKCYRNQMKLAEEIPLYKQASEIAAQQLGTNSYSHVSALINLAYLFAETGRLDDAKKIYEQCLSIADKNTNSRRIQHAAGLVHFCLADIAYRRGDFTEVENEYKRSLDLLRTSVGSEHPDTLLTYNCLTTFYEKLNKYKEAEQLLRTMLTSDEMLYGRTSPEVAADVSRLAQLLRKQGDTVEASTLEQRANKIKAVLPGPTNKNAPPIKIDVPSPGVLRKVKDKWAVVIGISEFKDNSLNLQYAAKDACDFKSYLIKDARFQPDHVKLLLNKEANRQTIIDTLGKSWLGRLADQDDMVVIFISTHGTKAAEDTSGKTFIVPYDCSIDDLLLSGIPIQWFTTGIGSMVQANRIVFVLDVCHADADATATPTTYATTTVTAADADATASGAKGMARSTLNPNKITLGTGQVLLAANDIDQSSWVSRTYANGVFTYRLMEALRLNGSNISLTKAFQQMREKVKQEVLRERGKLQTPIMIKRWLGEDPNLGVSPAAPRSATLK